MTGLPMQNDTHKTYLVELKDVLDEEAVGVVPGQEHIFEHITHALLLEAKVIRTHHRRVDQVQPVKINANDLLGLSLCVTSNYCYLEDA